MQITCTGCHRHLNLPDEKVPSQPFALTCPACKARIHVDPASARAAPAPPSGVPAAGVPAASAPPPGAPAAGAPAAGAPAARQPVSDATSGAPAPGAPADFEPLPAVRDLDKELLGELHPIAALVRLAPVPAEPFEAGLRLLGMKEVRQYSDLGAATDDMLDIGFAIVLLLLDRATAPPCEPLKPLYDLPLSVRRSTFVALAAENVRSLDGQTAFYLQVNCLINSQEMAKFPTQLQRALLFHLRQYRHWGVRAE